MALLFVYMKEFVMADEEMPDPDPDSDSTSRARSKAELAERALAGSEPLMLCVKFHVNFLVRGRMGTDGGGGCGQREGERARAETDRRGMWVDTWKWRDWRQKKWNCAALIDPQRGMLLQGFQCVAWMCLS
jgi:hypothetical protein